MSLSGAVVPRFLYGTAWKEDNTERLASLALEQGFRGIDTANQRRHYYEAGVGAAIQAAFQRGLVKREDLFLQTKFTFLPGQDHRLPYDPNAPIGVQVEQSFASSLEHLGVDVIDSYVLHGPSQRAGLGPQDWAAWRAMETIQQSGRARVLGVSNVSHEQLVRLLNEAQVKPSFVQNRCYAMLGWDRAVREVCNDAGIKYQGFSLLTANQEVLVHPVVRQLAQQHNRTVCQIVFRAMLDLGMLPLTGTSSAQHMREDLATLDFTLPAADTARIESLNER